MKSLVLALTVLVTLPVKAADIVGFVVLHRLNVTSHQPGNCASQEPREDGLSCIDFLTWSRYELRGLEDLRTGEVSNTTAVFATHTARAGRWLVVLEKLSPDDAEAFDAEYLIVDGGQTFEIACLKSPLNEVLPGETADRVGEGDSGPYCYDIQTVKPPES